VDAVVPPDERRQSVQVCRLDLCALAVLQDLCHQLVRLCKVGKDLGVGRVEPPLRALHAKRRQLAHVKEDVRELLRGVYVEVLPCHGVDVRDHLVYLGSKLSGLAGENRRVNGEAHALHLCKHRQERHLYPVHNVCRSVIGKTLRKRRD
jgi:hypothetical protein